MSNLIYALFFRTRFAILIDNPRFMLIVDTQLHTTWTCTRNDLKNHWINEYGDEDPNRVRTRPPSNVRRVAD